MRRTLTILGCLAVAATTGCDQAQRGVANTNDSVAVEIVAPLRTEAAAASAPPAAAAADSAAAPSPPPTARSPNIAYVYRYGLELPVQQVPVLAARHERSCTAAGAAVCQVIGSQSERYGRDELTAQLEIQATPAFITAFRARLSGDAEGAGGRLAQSATDSEDLTRALIDTEARLRALTTLRDRLQQLLATRSAPLEQLLATERELARVQGELDASRSTLDVMRTRVATSRLTIQYTALGQLAPDSAFRPVLDAFSNALAVFMAAVAALILFFAGVLPFLIVGTPLVWLFLRWRRRVRAEKLAEKRAAEGASKP